MGIYIEGMKMPKDENGFVKLVIFNDGRCFVAVGDNEVTSKTGTVTARELPPHGRLGDLDALRSNVYDSLTKQFYINQKQIEAAPTIIPADGGADDANNH